MERCSDGDSADNLVLLDLLSMQRKGADFPIARGDYVLVSEKPQGDGIQPPHIKVTYKPSFLDRLPPIDEEWAEVSGNDNRNRVNPPGGNAEAAADNNGAERETDVADNGQDRAENETVDTEAMDGL